MPTTDDLCAYCASPEPFTRDHVPPRGLFPPPRPSNLVTVPSCFDCNNRWGREDEYFVSRICSRADVADQPHLQAVVPPLVRSLQRPQAAGFSRALQDSLQAREFRTPAGIIIGRGTTIRVDNVRLNRVASRVVRGLYHSQFGQPPDGWGAVAWLVDSIEEAHARSMMAVAGAALRSAPVHTIGSTFKYRFHHFSKPGQSVWILRFFDRIDVFGMTREAERLTPAERLVFV